MIDGKLHPDGDLFSGMAATSCEMASNLNFPDDVSVNLKRFQKFVLSSQRVESYIGE